MIQLQNTSISFNGTKALDNLNLTINSGQILGLLGANGAGKSTTINLLLGFLAPDSGTVTINGIEVPKNIQAIRKLIGYIPENVNLYPYLTGLENLNYFCQLAGHKYSKTEQTNLLLECGLEQIAHNKRIETYSKGMRQKVGIAIAYSKKAKVYLLDEPASGLDPLASNELSELLKKLADQGAAILMASHDIFRVKQTCHRIGILKTGRLLEDIQASQISSVDLEKLYLNFMQN